MTAVKCPNCQKIVHVSRFCNDYVHSCQESNEPFLGTESKVLMGNWFDSDGTSGTVINSNLQGLQNDLQGTLPGEVEGERFSDKNIHGERASTHRIKSRSTYIDLTDGK